MKIRDLFGAHSVASPRHRTVSSRSDAAEIIALVLRLASVGLLTGVGWVHLHLWQIGYQYIPTIGPLFLAATISALLVAGGLLVRPSRLVGLLGFGLVVGIFAGLIVSVNVGLFGFADSLSAPFAVESIVLELAAAVCLVGWVGLDLVQDSRSRRRPLPGEHVSVQVADNRMSTSIRRTHANIQN